MAEAIFTPATAPGAIASQAIGAYGQGQSLMMRAQQARMQQEEFDRQQQVHAAMMPSLLAKANADTLTAQATIQNYNQVQALRSRFAQEAPVAQKEYEDAMQLADYGAQSDQLGKLQQKYSWMQLLPEGKPFAEGIANSRLQAHQDWQLNQRLEAEKDVARIRGDSLISGIEARGEETRQTNEAAGKGKTPQQKWYEAMKDAEANGDEEGATFYRQRLIKDTTVNAQLDQAERVRRLQTAVEQAKADGNTTAQAQYQQALDKYIAPTHSTNNDAFMKALGIAPGASATAPTPAAQPATQAAPAAQQRVPVAPPPRSYVVDPTTKAISLAPSVKQPKDVLSAFQQMIDDGVISEAAARAQLEKMGFKKKGQ